MFIVTCLQEADKRVTGLPERLTCPLALVRTWAGVHLQLTILHLHTQTHRFSHPCERLLQIKNYTRLLFTESLSIPPSGCHLEHFISISTNKYCITFLFFKMFFVLNIKINNWKIPMVPSNGIVECFVIFLRFGAPKWNISVLPPHRRFFHS